MQKVVVRLEPGPFESTALPIFLCPWHLSRVIYRSFIHFTGPVADGPHLHAIMIGSQITRSNRAWAMRRRYHCLFSLRRETRFNPVYLFVLL
jgi:hypothetical protein